MSGRHIMVDAECEWCHQPYKVKRTKFNAGKARFCSKVCSNAWAKAEGAKKWGYENGTPYKSGNHWIVRWYDDTGKPCNASYPRWWWEMNVGPVPEGMLVICKDGNSENINPENFMLGTRKEFSEVNAHKHIGVLHTEDAKKKMSASKSGRVLSEEHKRNIGNASRKLWASGVFDKVHVGEHNKKWRGGVHKKYTDEYRKIREFILDRDNYTCQICGKYPMLDRKAEVHHIDRNPDNNVYDNLILLCSKCHGAIHADYPTSPVIMAFREKLT